MFKLFVLSECIHEFIGEGLKDKFGSWICNVETREMKDLINDDLLSLNKECNCMSTICTKEEDKGLVNFTAENISALIHHEDGKCVVQINSSKKEAIETFRELFKDIILLEKDKR